MSSADRRRPGRPRHVPAVDNQLSPRDQILHAAARLFTDCGFAATSTREIADAVGIRQASLYYHFTGKDGILAELLQLSLRPSLDKIEKIELLCPDEVPEAALYMLALIDVRTLATAPHNIGMLHQMPDVWKTEAYDEIQPALQELNHTYGRLGAAILSDAVAATTSVKQLRRLLVQPVESVIKTRADGDRVTHLEARAIAFTCLRVCGVDTDRSAYVAARAEDLMPAFAEESEG